MKLRVLSLSLALVPVLAGSASAQMIKLEFVDGLVNLKAENASVAPSSPNGRDWAARRSSTATRSRERPSQSSCRPLLNATRWI
jgi:hypothetical protein